MSAVMKWALSILGFRRRGGDGAARIARGELLARAVALDTESEHLVTLDELAVGRRSEGHCTAVCGAEMVLHRLATPPRRECRSCFPAQTGRTSR